MEFISTSDYIVQEILYKAGSIELFTAVLASGQEFFVKKVKFLSPEGFNAIIREGKAMAALEHPNFVKFYGISQEESELNDRFILLFMEYPSRGDLSKEIKRRITDNEYWAEQELWDCFKSLIKAYSFLQRQRIAHRNIKPQNIFVGDDGTLKVGNFGCFLQSEDQERTILSDHTITGTPLYLSPKLREAYKNLKSGISDNRAYHDPFKSDVYSLGLTFLYMASLKDLTDLTDLNTLNYKKAQRINELRYSQSIKDFLSYMLENDEAKRPSFIKLEEILTNSIEGNMQVQPKFNACKIKATQISDFCMLQGFYSIKVNIKASYINPYFSYILQVIRNDANSYYVWALITFAKSMNCNIRIGTLTYKCYICRTGNINFLYMCNCGAKYFIHQECWNSGFNCPYCYQSCALYNESTSPQQDQIEEMKENSDIKIKIKPRKCFQCKKQKNGFTYHQGHRICEDCSKYNESYLWNSCILI